MFAHLSLSCFDLVVWWPVTTEKIQAPVTEDSCEMWLKTLEYNSKWSWDFFFFWSNCCSQCQEINFHAQKVLNCCSLKYTFLIVWQFYLIIWKRIYSFKGIIDIMWNMFFIFLLKFRWDNQYNSHVCALTIEPINETIRYNVFISEIQSSQ